MSDVDGVAFLVRHGRTALNAAGVLRGRLDPPLDEVGELEAHALADALRHEPVAAVVTSPLQRARQTASIITARNHHLQRLNVPLDVDPALTDRDYGPWAGMAPAEVERRFGSLDAAPGVEPAMDLATRVAAAVTSAVDRVAPRAVVVVAHDAVIRFAMCTLVPSLGGPSAIPQHTGRWNRIERRSGSWSAPVVDAPPAQARYGSTATKGFPFPCAPP